MNIHLSGRLMGADFDRGPKTIENVCYFNVKTARVSGLGPSYPVKRALLSPAPRRPLPPRPAVTGHHFHAVALSRVLDTKSPGGADARSGPEP